MTKEEKAAVATRQALLAGPEGKLPGGQTVREARAEWLAQEMADMAADAKTQSDAQSGSDAETQGEAGAAVGSGE